MWQLIRQGAATVFRFLLYSNCWIATAALCLSFQTEFLLLGHLSLRPLHGFIFFGTIFIYSTHRLVSLKRIHRKDWQERFWYIARGQKWLYIYTLFSLLIATVFYLWLPPKIKYLLLLPGILSLAYVFPVLRGGRRIRDVHFIKIFLIALVWAWLTVWIPAFDLHLQTQLVLWPMGLERLFFVFAITLPFDIRDLLLDNQQSVKTLPGLIGMSATRRLAFSLLLGMLTMTGIATYQNWYPISAAIALLTSAALAMVLVYRTNPDRSDLYFTGWLDGTMILQFLLVGWLTSFPL
jgi:4-hydroxybenzoate polyprenyltransferase